MPAYRVEIDRNACEGIFACLTRDPRFVEAADGLATVDPAADPVNDADEDASVRDEGDTIVAEFDDDNIAEARGAAAACPPDAITVTEVER